jgi:hypothetical protein
MTTPDATELEAEARKLWRCQDRERQLEKSGKYFPGEPHVRDMEIITEALAAAELRARDQALEDAIVAARFAWESPQDGFDEAFDAIIDAISALRPAAKGEK